MPRTALPGGIGAVGSAMARFFHPSKKIRDQWPNDDKRRLTAVLVTGEATRAVTFLLSVAEVNAVQARARAKKEIAMPTLDFRKQLAMRMMTNKLNNNGLTPASPKRTRAHNSSEHVIVKRQKNEGSWNVYTRTFNMRDTLYIPHPCSECRKNTRSYCKCDPGRPLCMACFGVHAREHGC